MEQEGKEKDDKATKLEKKREREGKNEQLVFSCRRMILRLQVLRLFWCPCDIYVCPHLKIIMPFIHVVLEECTP